MIIGWGPLFSTVSHDVADLAHLMQLWLVWAFVVLYVAIGGVPLGHDHHLRYWVAVQLGFAICFHDSISCIELLAGLCVYRLCSQPVSHAVADFGAAFVYSINLF